jgi:hypothetical protein
MRKIRTVVKHETPGNPSEYHSRASVRDPIHRRIPSQAGLMRFRFSAHWRHLPIWVVAAIPLLVFMLFVMREVMLPGLHFDEVNPDYLVVKMLDWTKVGTTPSWQYRDNIFSPDYRWPVMATVYAGVPSVYLSIPFHAFLGFNVFTLRFFHACYGLAILAVSFAIVYRVTQSRLAALVGALILAIDAGFLLTFRTQFELPLFPLSFLLVTVFLLLPQRGDQTSGARFAGEWRVWKSRYFGAGLSYGFACYSYFHIGFFLPALLLYFYIYRAELRLHHWVAFFLGAAIGSSPWFFGMASSGWFYYQDGQSFFSHLAQVDSTFVFGQTVGWSERIFRPLSLLADAVSNFTQPRMVTHAADASALTEFKLALTLFSFLAACFGLWAWGNPGERRAVWLLIFLVVSFLCISLMFGPRMSVHHLNLNLPLIYIFIGISLAPWLRRLAVSNRPEMRSESVELGETPLPGVIFSAALVAVFLAVSLFQQSSLFRELRRTGGSGYFSEMRVLLAYDLLSNYKNTVSFFPDWGFFTQVVYLSRGEVQIDRGLMPEAVPLKQALCSGKDALIIVEGGDRRSVADAAAARADVAVTRWKSYFQRDGKINFELAVIAAGQPTLNCGSASGGK